MAKYNIVTIFRFNKKIHELINVIRLSKLTLVSAFSLKTRPLQGYTRAPLLNLKISHNERFPPFQPITAQLSSRKRKSRPQAGLSIRDAQLNK